MHTLVTILHVLACVILIMVVLLQAGKGANMGAAFGGSSQTVFGSSGAGTFLGKMTAAVAIIFMLTSLTLTYTSGHRGSALFDKSKTPLTKQAAPVTPMPNAASPAANPNATNQPTSAPVKK
jgi:preprotein translocase subunit SecG